jgi:glycine cleavage system H protein
MSTHYTKDHEWARLEGEVAMCGISKFAAKQLGEVVFVELPEIGRVVKAGEAMAVVESAKAASDIYAPVAGEIVAANVDFTQDDEKAREAALALISSDPENAGWFVKIKPTQPGDVEGLMNSTDYAAHIG